MEDSLNKMIPSTRIKAKPKVIVQAPGESFQDILIDESKEAEIVFLGLADPVPGKEAAYADTLIEMVEKLPTVILVKNSSVFTGKLV